MQSRRRSFIEQLANVAIGYTVGVVSQVVILPMFDINVPLSSNLGIGLWFTGVSLVRGYCVRRWFNRKDGRYANDANIQ